MKGFYDNILVKSTDKLVKKYGAKVGDTELPSQKRFLHAGWQDHWTIVSDTGKDLPQYGVFDTQAKAKAKASELSASIGGTKVHSLDISNELRDAAINEGFSMFQGGQDDRKGKIVFGEGQKRNFDISLFKSADESTFLHEMGHFYLEVMNDLASDANAPEGVKQDLEKIKSYLGSTDGTFTSEQHETFARSFEAYLMEGKAPSADLRDAFTKFKVWLTNIYRRAKNLDVPINDEIRGVFDRLLATDDEIKAAEQEMHRTPLFSDAKAAGMSDAQAEAYVKAREEAHQAAESALAGKVMGQYNRTRKEAWKSKETETRDQVQAEADKLPVYRTIDRLTETPETGPALRVSPSGIDKDLLRKLPKGIISTEDGLDFNVVADILGYSSGEAMLSDIAAAPKKKAFVEQHTAEKMREAYPEIIASQEFPEEALKAVHNDRTAKVLMMELKHLASNDMNTLKGVIKGVARRMPDSEVVRQQAEKIIFDRTIGDINPRAYQFAEVKAARRAGELLAKGDIDGAFASKQQELLNHELYRASQNAKDYVQEALDGFKVLAKPDSTLAKNRDMSLVNAARAVLSQVGITRMDKPAAEYLNSLKRYDVDSYDAIASMVEAIQANKKNYRDMRYADFQDVKVAVDALWNLSRSTMQMKIDGKVRDIAEVRGELKNRIIEVTKPGERAGYDKAVSTWDKTKIGLLGIKAALRRVESWADSIDGNDTHVFRDNLVRPVMEATAHYRTDKNVYLLKYIEKLSSITDFVKGPNVISKELGYEFTRAEILGAMLHTGNESNMSKLLRGRGWGSMNEAGELDTSRWDNFIRKMQADGTLTKNEYDFVQSVWDLMEELKPKAQKAHKEMYGYYFNEVTAKEFNTPFGTYKGGYVPANADPFLSSDAAVRGEKEAVENSANSYQFPTTGRGFTKARVEAYAKPLAIDLRFVPSHIDKLLRFVHIEPTVKDAGRLIRHPDFRETLDVLDPTIGGDMLGPWLQRAASQKIMTPSTGWGGKALDTIFREIRNRTGLQVLTANVNNALQQLGGFSNASLKVEPKYLRDSLWNYMRSPKQTAADIAEKSEYMRTKLSANSMELQKSIDEILIAPNGFEKAVDFAKKHGQMLTAASQGLVDVVTFGAAYDKAVEAGRTEHEAVLDAESAIRLTQGGFNAEDLSRFETGTPFARAFTMFYSYFNMQSNLLGTEFNKITRSMGLKKGLGRGLYVYTLGFMLPAVFAETVLRSLSGKLGENDDGSYMDDAMSIFFGSQFRNLTAMLPGVGQAVNAGVNLFNDKWYDDRMSTSPSVSMIESAVASPHSVYEAAINDGSKKKAVRDSLTALGMVFNLPLAPLSRPIGYQIDVNEGNKTPTGPFDYVRGLATGK